MKTKRFMMAAAAAGAAFAATNAMAVDSFSLDSNGIGAGGVIPNFATFDWAPGNAEGVLSNSSIQTFIATAGAVNIPFTTVYQAKLSALLDGSNGNVTPAGLGSTYEYTITAKFQENIANASAGPGGPGSPGSFAQFNILPGGTLNIYYQDNNGHGGLPNANDLAGTGFADGTLILTATIGTQQNFASSFANTGGAPTVVTPLDAFGTNNYPAIQSITGIGTTQVNANVTFANSEFFGGVAPSTLALTIFNTNQNLNFTQVDPAAAFFDGTPGATVAQLGTINGVNGNSILFQADAANSFTVAPPPPGFVPEPMSAGLGMMGIAALGMSTLRRRRMA